MATLSSLIILLLLSFSIFPFIIHGTNEKEKQTHLIHKTCKISAKTDPNINYAFCTSALQAKPAKQCATLRRIGTTCIKLVMTNVTDTRHHIQGLVKGGKVKHDLRKCIDHCYEMYTDAAPDVGGALSAYRDKKYGDANIKLSAVMDAAADCEDLFGRSRRHGGGCGGVSPLSERNNATFQLSAMALSVMHLIKEGKAH
ncbi:putative invertase inhibitor [Ipomoea triloba]|uniref:putative invertase inhibitor n=1 Tax=Ipomoea triloba TaxID=35885 RepID=UPI00125E0105|nr:putative invertase inhibitor [Ipomoea triloba]